MAVGMVGPRRGPLRPVESRRELARGRRPGRPGLLSFVVVFAVYACLAFRAWDGEDAFGPLNWYTSLFWSLRPFHPRSVWSVSCPTRGVGASTPRHRRRRSG